MHTFCVGCCEASLFLTLETPLSALFKEPCIFPWAVTADASVTKPWLSVLSSVSLLSCWANGCASAVGCQQQCSQVLAVAVCGTGAQQHLLTTPSNTPLPGQGFIYSHFCGSGCRCSLNLRCSLWVWAWRTHQPFLSKTRHGHNWPVHLVSCWKSRFCCDVRAVAPCNHVHTQPQFNYALEGKTEGLSGFYFKVPFQGKLAAQATIQILLLLQAKRLVLITQMSTCWSYSLDFLLDIVKLKNFQPLVRGE